MPIRFLLLAAMCIPLAAHAQPARNANVYDSTAHQPTAGVQSEERAAGVAPTPGKVQQENRDLGAISQQLLGKAQEDAKTAPQAGHVYGAQPGGVVETTPPTGATGGGTR